MRAVVGEDREMDRRFLEARQLQAGIDRVLLSGVAGERLLVGLREAPDHGTAALHRFDMHEPPRLAEADRRRVARNLQQRVDALARHRVAAKAPHVAPPQNEVAELGPEGRVKVRMRRHQLHRSIE